MRQCKRCGLLEHRQKDAKGRETLNLDPVSGLCVSCLSQSLGPKPMEPTPFDPRKAAANDE